MLPQPVTLHWHRADQLCFVVPLSSWIPCKQGPFPFLTSLVWLDPAATGNWTHITTWSVLSPPYRRLLRSEGATEDLFVTRALHQEPPPRIPTGSVNISGVKWRRRQTKYTHTHTHIHTYIHTYIHPKVHINTHTHTHTNKHTNTHTTYIIHPATQRIWEWAIQLPQCNIPHKARGREWLEWKNVPLYSLIRLYNAL